MNKSALFVIALVTIAFCSSTKGVSYDSVLSKLVELNQAVGKDNNDIGILVSQVSQSVKEVGEKFDSFVSGLNQNCEDGIKLLEGFINKLEGDRTSAQATSEKAEGDNKHILEERERLSATLTQAQSDLEGVKQKIAENVENFKVQGAEAEHKLVIVKTLKDIITDELLAPQPGSSFVQLRTFSDKLTQLKSLLVKSRDHSYTPLVTSLLSLAQGKGWSDQKILSQILDVLSKLENNLREFRNKQNTEGRNNIENLKAIADEKLKQIKSIAFMIADANSNFQDNESIIKTVQNQIEAITQETARKTTELNYWKKTCDYQHELATHDKNFREDFDGKVKSINEKFSG